MHIIYLVGYLVWAVGYLWTIIYRNEFMNFKNESKDYKNGDDSIPRHQLESFSLEKGGTVLFSEVLFGIGIMMAFIRLLQVTRKLRYAQPVSRSHASFIFSHFEATV